MHSETTQILNFLASAGPFANSTASLKQTQEIMQATSGSIISCGCLYNIISKQLCPGVYKLTLKRFSGDTT